ncbi:MAG: hypothetical protein IH946_10105 [Bacteroidetes bacterium]|nr:hypothetical protein [Bacteroidota bacterium]
MISDTLSNAQKYHFADFTFEHYRKLLRIAAETHVFRLFSDYKEDENFAIIRHDADYSMQASRRIARIEKEEGVKSTYFVRLHSECYNLFESKNVECLYDIVEMGHRVDLHFDPEFYGVDNHEDLIKYMELEKRTLEDHFDLEVNAFTFHNPTASKVSANDQEYAGMINGWSPYFKDQVAYCSDSNGMWRFGRMEDFLLRSKDLPMQLLTHPEWWTEKAMSPREKIDLCINGRAEWTRKFIDDFIVTKNGREIIDWK